MLQERSYQLWIAPKRIVSGVAVGTALLMSNKIFGDLLVPEWVVYDVRIEEWFAVPRIIELCRTGAIDTSVAEDVYKTVRFKWLVVIKTLNAG
ncbi:MAG: hypothetical protein WBW33_11270, partial [Bryobacteraceae bacterium]